MLRGVFQSNLILVAINFLRVIPLAVMSILLIVEPCEKIRNEVRENIQNYFLQRKILSKRDF